MKQRRRPPCSYSCSYSCTPRATLGVKHHYLLSTGALRRVRASLRGIGTMAGANGNTKRQKTETTPHDHSPPSSLKNLSHTSSSGTVISSLFWTMMAYFGSRLRALRDKRLHTGNRHHTCHVCRFGVLSRLLLATSASSMQRLCGCGPAK